MFKLIIIAAIITGVAACKSDAGEITLTTKPGVGPHLSITGEFAGADQHGYIVKTEEYGEIRVRYDHADCEGGDCIVIAAPDE